jgi:hypothetical protein
MKTTAEQIKNRLINGFDKQYYESLDIQTRKTFGDACEATGIVSSSGQLFPDYRDIRLEVQEIGVSQRILNTQFITLSRIMRADPEPEFPQVDKWTAEVRKQFFLERSRGTGYADGEWMAQHVATFLDGDGLGRGITQIGLKTNPATGKQRVHLRNVPVKQVLVDRNERSLTRARWICFLHYVPLDVAGAMYGAKVVKDHTHRMMESNADHPIECVRIFEYYDLGFGKGTPTMAVIPGDIGNEPLYVEENPFGCLPVAFYEHLIRPGMRWATGRISLLLAGEESINEAERAMRSEMRRVGFDVVTDALNVDDLDRVNDGEHGVVARLDRPLATGEQPHVRIPGGEIQQTALVYLEHLDKQFTADSGVTDLDRGSDVEGAETLGEVQLTDARSKTQSNWSVYQTAKYFQRVVEKVLKIAAVGDLDPTILDIFGNNIPINDETQPASMIEAWLEEPSNIIISEEALLKNDAEQESVRKMNKLAAIQPFTDPMWFGEEMIKAAGYDPKEAMGQMGQAMGAGIAIPGQQQVPA